MAEEDYNYHLQYQMKVTWKMWLRPEIKTHQPGNWQHWIWHSCPGGGAGGEHGLPVHGGVEKAPRPPDFSQDKKREKDRG